MQSQNNFPKPRIPILPILSGKSVSLARVTRQDVPVSVRDAGDHVMVTRGAHAIALVLEMIGVNAGDEVLVPAFNCPSMVEPIQWMSARPVYVRINNLLELDLDDVDRKITGRSRALLAPHFFGFPQKIQEIRKLCDSRNIVLIEDCAHAFFGSAGGKPLGFYGDFAIASTRKFFPCNEGGLLVCSRGNIERNLLQRPGVIHNIRCAFDLFEESLEYGRFPVAGKLVQIPISLKKYIAGLIKGNKSGQGAGVTDRTGHVSYIYMNPDVYRNTICIPSKLAIMMSDETRIVRERRSNYLKISRGLSNLSHGRPLFPELNDDVTPYMVPFYIAAPEIHFARLKMAGVPIWRWEESALGHCAVSDEYAFKILQLPCHQELADDEIEWMINTIRQIIND